jgi:hypothetical protein
MNKTDAANQMLAFIFERYSTIARGSVNIVFVGNILTVRLRNLYTIPVADRLITFGGFKVVYEKQKTIKSSGI